ncbi:MAG: TMEM143 family protein [Desulfobacterales bacterium]
MADDPNRDRFIPFRKADIVTMCCDGSGLSVDEAEAFREFFRILDALFHFEFHRRLETLKNCFAPFNPDADTRPLKEFLSDEIMQLQRELVAEMTAVLNAANFERITARDLEQALAEESLFKIRLEVDFDDFEDVIFFRRGESTRQETLVTFFGLRKKRFNFTNYDRVAVYLKFKEKQYFDDRNRQKLNFVPGSTIIKLFQDVPKADLEMLFPNSKVRMKTIDKLIIGVPAAVSGIVVIVTRLGATLLLIASVFAFWMGFSQEETQLNQKHLIALGAGLATLGGFLFRQFNKFKNRKIKFMKALADNLYFKNLDNNAGVFYHLIDAAEEEEVKEAVLAYFFLLKENRPMEKGELDDLIENWFETRWNCKINFEIDDALIKLERLELVTRDGNSLQCLPLADAKRQLDHIWDNYFTFN